jgi:hypothetical protein
MSAISYGDTLLTGITAIAVGPNPETDDWEPLNEWIATNKTFIRTWPSWYYIEYGAPPNRVRAKFSFKDTELDVDFAKQRSPSDSQGYIRIQTTDRNTNTVSAWIVDAMKMM